MKKIIFYAHSSQSWDSYFPILIELLRSDESIKDFISVCAPCHRYDFRNALSKKLFEIFKSQYSGAPVDGNCSINGSSFVLVTTHIPESVLGLDSGYSIFVPHGTGFGSDYSLRCFQRSNIYCGHSPDEQVFVHNALGSRLNQAVLFVPTGCPKNDMFSPYIFASQKEKEVLKRKAKLEMNISPDKTVIFIGSHWTPTGLLRKFGTSLIQALSLLGDNVRIIQGSHPNLWNQQFNTIQHVRPQTSQWIYNALCRERERGNVILNFSVNDSKALLASDIVISDFSSIALEASLLQLPLYLHLDHPPHPWEEYNLIYSGIGIQFSGADELIFDIMNDVKFPSSREEMLRKNNKLNGFNIGRASAKVADTILTASRDL